MRVHMGCGAAYLVSDDPEKPWVNVDMPGEGAFLAGENPDLVEAYKTTEDDYYKKIGPEAEEVLKKRAMSKKVVRPVLYDKEGSFMSIPCGDGEMTELLARQVFEHMSWTEARQALVEMRRAAKPGALIRLDVPDTEETLRLLMDKQDWFFARHLMGPRRNDYGYHMMSYTRDGLRALCKEYWFLPPDTNLMPEEEKNIHFYPAFCLRFIAPGKLD